MMYQNLALESNVAIRGLARNSFEMETSSGRAAGCCGSNMPVSRSTAKAVAPSWFTASNRSPIDQSARGVKPTGKGEPGTGARDPSSLMRKPEINGVSGSPTKRNCGTVAAIGVGVGLGVVPGVGVGETFGVGVGEGLSFTIRRGEITQPAINRSKSRSAATTIASWFGRQGKCRI